MALSPETTDALRKALDAVVQECGDDPAYAELVDHLEAAQDALPEADEAEPRDGEDDDHSFETAEKRMASRRKGGDSDGGNPFAKDA